MHDSRVLAERPRSRRFSAAIELFSVAIILAAVMVPNHLQATELVRDDFEDGIIDSTLYSALGGAILEESGGKLRVTVFNQNDGIRIAAPPGAVSFLVTQKINQPEFDIGEAITFKALTLDPNTSEEVPFLEATMLRPFWNFCVYNISQGGSNSTIGIFCGRGLTSRDSCPDEKDLRLDWLPPLPGETQDRVVYQVRDKDGTWRFGKSRPSNLSHSDGDLTGYTITFKHIDPDFCLD